ncbi:uncharacterized protein LOC125086646 isoform X2 [Lutra lutra]|uniref:uncharacterized protein LOC125086646 isoform X2 n=1 Tax=Lutra lutra TaxID=9657 RepID=UPI001FCF899A|nr:uncharacterized protein LOC125086646 isoform X2 [Lutra lutra]
MDSGTRSRTLPQPLLLLSLSFLHPNLLESTWRKIVRPNTGRMRKQRGLRKQKWALETGPSVRRLEIIPPQEPDIAVGDVCAADMTPGDGRSWLPAALLLLHVPVTLENLTEGDTGTYRCGIDTSWLPEYLLDLTFRVVLSVTPGPLSLSGPSTVMGTMGGSLSVQCRYEEKYKTFTKYWCRQPCLPPWNQTVATGRSEEKMRSGRVSIVDHAEDLTFTVTLENLTADDAGRYRCGIATILHEEGLHGLLPDLFFQVQVFVSPRSRVVSVYFLLLILLKVPLFLMMLSVILWVNRSQWAICGTQSRPDEDNMQPSLSIDNLSRDTATQTRRGRTSGPKPSISSHLVPQNQSLLSRVLFLLLVILKVSLLLTMLTDGLGVSSLLVGILTKGSFSPSFLWICCPDTQPFRGEKRRFTTSDLPIFLLMA